MPGRFCRRRTENDGAIRRPRCRDIERLKDMLDFADCGECRTRFLLNYFGEQLPGDCGHCDTCEGIKPKTLPILNAPPLGDAEAAILDEIRGEGHEALRSVRQVARFLCGISSPAATRTKLTKHPYFGVWSHKPFQQVLKFIDENARRRTTAG